MLSKLYFLRIWQVVVSDCFCPWFFEQICLVAVGLVEPRLSCRKRCVRKSQPACTADQPGQIFNVWLILNNLDLLCIVFEIFFVLCFSNLSWGSRTNRRYLNYETVCISSFCKFLQKLCSRFIFIIEKHIATFLQKWSTNWFDNIFLVILRPLRYRIIVNFDIFAWILLYLWLSATKYLSDCLQVQKPAALPLKKKILHFYFLWGI